MKTLIFIISAIIIMSCGCVEKPPEQVRITLNETTTQINQTSTSSTTTISTQKIATTTTTLKNISIYPNCDEYCIENGFLGGACRLNRFECDARLEKKIESRVLCQDYRMDTCCCRTPESVDRDVDVRIRLENTKNTPVKIDAPVT